MFATGSIELLPQPLPGAPLPPVEPYGPAHMGDRQEKGEYYLRSMYGSQPSVLRKGDVLATGQRVCEAPRDAGDGKNILVNLDGEWKVIPAWALLGFKTDWPNPDIGPWREWAAQYRAEQGPDPSPE